MHLSRFKKRLALFLAVFFLPFAFTDNDWDEKNQQAFDTLVKSKGLSHLPTMQATEKLLLESEHFKSAEKRNNLLLILLKVPDPQVHSTAMSYLLYQKDIDREHFIDNTRENIVKTKTPSLKISSSKLLWELYPETTTEPGFLKLRGAIDEAMESELDITREFAIALQDAILFRSYDEIEDNIESFLNRSTSADTLKLAATFLIEMAPLSPLFVEDVKPLLRQKQQHFNTAIEALQKDRTRNTQPQIASLKDAIKKISQALKRINEVEQEASSTEPRFKNLKREQRFSELVVNIFNYNMAKTAEEKKEALNAFISLQQEFPHTHQARQLLAWGLIYPDEKLRKVAYELSLRRNPFDLELQKLRRKTGLIIPFERVFKCEWAYRELILEDIKKN